MMMDRCLHGDVHNGPSSADGGGLGRNRISAAASIVAVVGADGRTRLPVLASQVPLVLRRTPEAVYVVGGAAGPIGGDRLGLRITVRAGAALRVRTAAAAIALPGPDGLESVLGVTIDLEPGARLEYLPEPVVVSAGARHATVIQATLAEGASLRLRDEVLLGRHGEAGGDSRTELRVTYAGRPLVRQSLEVSGADPADRGPAVLAGHRGVGTLLLAGPAVDACPGAGGDPATGTDPPTVAVMPLAGPGILVTALADDAVTLRRRLSATPST
jgi:urease accessory protein